MTNPWLCYSLPPSQRAAPQRAASYHRVTVKHGQQPMRDPPVPASVCHHHGLLALSAVQLMTASLALLWAASSMLMLAWQPLVTPVAPLQCAILLKWCF